MPTVTTLDPAEPPVLAADGIEYRYGDVAAVSGLSIEIRRGARVALVGANGSGKSTFLRLLDGLLLPHSGRLWFDGQPLTEKTLSDDELGFAFRRRVALLFQDSDAQLFNPTVFDEVAFGLLQLGWPSDRVADCVMAQLQAMRIEHLRDRPPYQLSGGEKKRTALASILVLDPEVLLLDEPTASLDPKSRDEFLDLLLDLPEDRTVVTATHELDLVREIATSCHVMSEGTIVAEGPVDQILRDDPLLVQTNLISRRRARDGRVAPIVS
jgi:cobalt/nickel transport system ATP-binding protein